MKTEMIVKLVGEMAEGVSQRTGDKWKSRALLLEWTDNEGTHRIWASAFNIVLSQFEQQNIVAGDVCHVSVGFSARSYRTGFCRTEATIQSIEKRKDYLI